MLHHEVVNAGKLKARALSSGALAHLTLSARARTLGGLPDSSGALEGEESADDGEWHDDEFGDVVHRVVGRDGIVQLGIVREDDADGRGEGEGNLVRHVDIDCQNTRRARAFSHCAATRKGWHGSILIRVFTHRA